MTETSDPRIHSSMKGALKMALRSTGALASAASFDIATLLTSAHHVC
ncbi:MAG: hypothetical protein QXO66_04765 [Thermofilum sp.]